MVGPQAINRIGVCCLVFCALAAISATPSGATIIRCGDGSGNTTAPTDDPGWANVGLRASASAVYIGDGWVLTAAHVGGGTTTLDGVSYSMEPGTWHRLRHPAEPGWEVDLGLFQLTEIPAGLPGLTISDAPLSVGSAVVGIGNGRNRAIDPTAWNGDWEETAPPGDYGGFKFGSGSQMRWGTNEVTNLGLSATDYGATYTIDMVFDETGGDDFEMQAVPGDSGGGLFYKNAGAWELAGIIIGRRTYKDLGQPTESAVYGNESAAADLSRYRSQIMEIIPEPSIIAMLLGLGTGCLAWSLWRRLARPSAR